MSNVESIILKFIYEMEYLENKHVLGAFFYGSFLTGFNEKHSDIDLSIIFDNEKPDRLVRGNKYIDGIRIEYFEKPIEDVYLSIENDFSTQSNASLSIIGTSKILFDKDGSLKKLQNYALDKFANPLPKLEEEEAKEQISILNNRMEKLKKQLLKIVLILYIYII